MMGQGDLMSIFRGLEKVVRKQRRVDLYKIRAEVKQSRALASDALALMDSEACSEAQSKARQDTQPAKQGVEHAQVSWQGPDSSQKSIQHYNIFSIGLDADSFSVGLKFLPATSGAWPTSPLVQRHVGAPFTGATQSRNKIPRDRHRKQTFSVLGPVVLSQVVTAGLLFVCLFPSWGNCPRRENGRSCDTTNQTCLSMSSHATAKGEKSTAQSSKVGEAVEPACHDCTAP
jgi:hypothetical protein